MRFLDLRDGAGQGVPRTGIQEEPTEAVRGIIEDVRAGGDAALYELTKRFDGVEVASLRVPQEDIEQAANQADPELIQALTTAANRIKAFSEHQALSSWETELAGGIVGERVYPLSRAGIYAPGGRASYPSSVLMGAGPALVAGVRDLALCVPAGPDGKIVQATLAAAAVAGIVEIYAVGGAQAIAALALGTESIKPVEIIVGPGNKYVATAKKLLAGSVAIDSVAGPSEIAIVADASADPTVLAWDLIAQAEHGPGGSFVLASWEEGVLTQTKKELESLLLDLDDEDLSSAVRAGFAAVLVRDLEQAAKVMNEFAPEHLELIFEDAAQRAGEFQSAGAVFVGPYSPVPFGDYISGTNHVLPTGGTARWASGLRTSHFQRTTTTVSHTLESLRASAPDLKVLAQAEGLPLHAKAVEARLTH